VGKRRVAPCPRPPSRLIELARGLRYAQATLKLCPATPDVRPGDLKPFLHGRDKAVVPRGERRQFRSVKDLWCPTPLISPIVFQCLFLRLSHRFLAPVYVRSSLISGHQTTRPACPLWADTVAKRFLASERRTFFPNQASRVRKLGNQSDVVTELPRIWVTGSHPAPLIAGEIFT
jgi:hypothetical protein